MNGGAGTASEVWTFPTRPGREVGAAEAAVRREEGGEGLWADLNVLLGAFEPLFISSDFIIDTI